MRSNVRNIDSLIAPVLEREMAHRVSPMARQFVLHLRDDRKCDGLRALTTQRQAHRRAQPRAQPGGRAVANLTQEIVAPRSRTEQTDVADIAARQMHKGARIEQVVVIHDQRGVETSAFKHAVQSRDMDAVDAAAFGEARPAATMLDQFDVPAEQARQQQKGARFRSGT